MTSKPIVKVMLANHRQNDTLFQREYRKDRAGNIIHERVHPVEWVIGSGNALVFPARSDLGAFPIMVHVRIMQNITLPPMGFDKIRPIGCGTQFLAQFANEHLYCL